MSDLIKASNWYQTRAHYTVSMLPMGGEAGFRGEALCSSYGMQVAVWDQSHHDSMWQRGLGPRPKDPDKLPLCKKCAKKAEGLDAST